MRRVLVQVSEGTHEAWKRRAFSEGRSMSELARDLIERTVLDPGRGVPEVRPSVPVAAETLRPEPTVVRRPHMKRNRPAIQCPTVELVDGVCPECGWQE